MTGSNPIGGPLGTSTGASAGRARDAAPDDGFLGTARAARVQSLVAGLRGMDGGQLDAMLDRLDPADLAADRLPADARHALFQDLASKAGGRQLAGLSAVLDDDSKQALAQAVAGSQRDQLQLDYVAALAPGMRPGTSETTAVGTVLGSLRGRAADQGFALLDAAQLGLVMTAVQSGLCAGGVAGMAEAALSGEDSRGKARLLQAAAGQGASTLTALLNSDTPGVVGAFADRRSGRALAAYVRDMVSDGRTADLGVMLSQLQHGGPGAAPDGARFLLQLATNARGERFYANAQNLGVFSGAVASGISEVAADRIRQSDMLAGVFGAALGPGTQSGAEALPTLANGLTKQAIADMAAAVASGERDLSSAMAELASPREGPAQADFMAYHLWVVHQSQ